MAERRIVNGWIYERGADGRITPVGPAQSAPQMPSDPAFPYKGEGAALDNAGKRADIQNDRERIALERERVRLAQSAQARAGQAADRAAAIEERERNSKLANLRALQNQIGTVRDLYRKGPGATKGVAGVMDYLPTPGNKAFDSAGAGLSELGLSAFRVPGVGTQSDAELRAFMEANRPSASDYDEQIEQKLRNLENRLVEAYKPYGVQYRPPTRAPRRPAPSAPRKPASGGGEAKFLGWEGS